MGGGGVGGGDLKTHCLSVAVSITNFGAKTEVIDLIGSSLFARSSDDLSTAIIIVC
jgi:hypothetical protein